MNFQSRLVPVDYQVVFAEHAGVAEAHFSLDTNPEPDKPLGFWSRSGGFDAGHGLHQQLGAELGQPLAQLLGVFQQANGDGALQQHRPGIEALLHGHDPYAGAAVALQQAPLDRSSATPAGQ